MKKNSIAKWLLALCAALQLPSCQLEKEEVSLQEPHDEEELFLSMEQIGTAELHLQEPHAQEFRKKLSFPATLVLNEQEQAHIVLESNAIAREVYKNLGDPVFKGELLAVLESREIAEAKANYLASLRRHFLAKQTADRETELHAHNLTATADYLEAAHQLGQTVIERDLAKQQLQALGVSSQKILELERSPPLDLRLHELYAPLDGLIISRDIAQGELMAAGSTPYTVANLSTVWVKLAVPSQDVAALALGQTLAIHADDQEGESRLIYISPMIDPQTQTVTVIAALDNPQGLWRPGGFVKADVFTTHVQTETAVPKTAIQRIDGKPVLFVASEQGLEPRVVETGLCDEENIEILSGIQPGERCATRNTFVLKSELLKGDEE